ncbi:MAG: hypothetical protein ACOCV2_05705 [Persicimonas sp.]
MNTTQSSFVMIAILALIFLGGAAGCGDADPDDNNANERPAVEDCETLDSAPTADVALEGCYRVTDALYVEDDVLVTVEPGTWFLFDANAGLQMNGARLKAEGTEEAPITFTGVEEVPGYWRGLDFRSTNSPDNVLDHVVVEYGGGEKWGTSGSFFANINLNDFDGATRVQITNSTLRHSEGFGMAVRNESVLESFEDNTVTDNEAPARISANRVEQLGTTSEFEGNEDDHIHVYGDVVDAVTWPRLDVPYLMQELVTVEEEAYLTIAPGTTLIFTQDTGIWAYEGILTAQGTADEPILFTGVEQIPGYWLGLEFHATNSGDNIIEHAVVEYGGSDTFPSSGSGVANITVTDFYGATRLRLNETTVRASGDAGLYIRQDSVVEGCSNVTFEENEGDDIVYAADAEESCPTS